MKCNTAFRQRRPDGIEPGEYSFRNFVGDRDTVRTSLLELQRRFAKSTGGERQPE